MNDPGAILITGCSSGIGRAAAEYLASRGHLVYATARRVQSIADLEPIGCRTLQLDVLDEASMRAAVDAVEAEHGAVGALVNNAGYAVSGAIEAVALDDVRKEFETNLFGYLRMAQLVLPEMRRRAALPRDAGRAGATEGPRRARRPRLRCVPSHPDQAPRMSLSVWRARHH